MKEKTGVSVFPFSLVINTFSISLLWRCNGFKLRGLEEGDGNEDMQGQYLQ